MINVAKCSSYLHIFKFSHCPIHFSFETLACENQRTVISGYQCAVRSENNSYFKAFVTFCTTTTMV